MICELLKGPVKRVNEMWRVERTFLDQTDYVPWRRIPNGCQLQPSFGRVQAGCLAREICEAGSPTARMGICHLDSYMLPMPSLSLEQDCDMFSK